MPQHYMEYSQYDYTYQPPYDDYTYQPPYVSPVQHDRDDAFNGLQTLSEQIRLINEQLAYLEEGEGQNQNRNTYRPPHKKQQPEPPIPPVFYASCMSKERCIS